MFTEDICVLELDLSNINYRNICAIKKNDNMFSIKYL